MARKVPILTFTIPVWLNYALMWLGFTSLVLMPIAIAAGDPWAMYVIEVVFAIPVAWVARRRIRHTTLLREGRSQITWWRYGAPTPEEQEGLVPAVAITWSAEAGNHVPSKS